MVITRIKVCAVYPNRSCQFQIFIKNLKHWRLVSCRISLWTPPLLLSAVDGAIRVRVAVLYSVRTNMISQRRRIITLTSGSAVSEAADSALVAVAVLVALAVAEEASVDDDAGAEFVSVLGGPLGPGQPSPGRMMSYAYTSRAKYCSPSESCVLFGLLLAADSIMPSYPSE